MNKKEIKEELRHLHEMIETILKTDRLATNKIKDLEKTQELINEDISELIEHIKDLEKEKVDLDFIPGHIYYGTVADNEKMYSHNIFYCFKQDGEKKLITKDGRIFNIKTSNFTGIQNITSDTQKEIIDRINDRDRRIEEQGILHNKIEDQK